MSNDKESVSASSTDWLSVEATADQVSVWRDAMAVWLYLSMSSKRVMAAALVQGKTWRIFFIRHRQCSVYSLKLSDSCLSWTQEGPSVIASRTLAVRHFWLHQKPWWMSVKSWTNEMAFPTWWKGLFLKPTERGRWGRNLPDRPLQQWGPTLHQWSAGGAAAGSSTPSGSDGGYCSTASDCVKTRQLLPDACFI